MIRKNDEYNTIIEDVTLEGSGIVHIDGFPVYVENALPQEKVTIRITKVLNRFAFARVISFETTSQHRVPITDKKGTWVGTMPLQHMSYDYQCELKQREVYQSLEAHIDMTNIEVLPTLGAQNPWQYRNKAQVPVQSINNQLETGLYKRGTHELVPIDNYHIQHPEIDAAILIIRDILRNYNIEAYNEQSHTGLIRNVMIRHGYVSREMMVVLVTNGAVLPHENEIIERIKEQLPNVVSIIQNINTEQTNRILGREQMVLYGEDIYHDKLLGKTFAISSQSFYQVNVPQTEVLYQTAIDFAQISNEDTVIDAYCGIGTISLNLADRAKHVYAVEVVEDAIRMANLNAKANDINNITFEVGKAEEVMQRWVDEGIEVDVIVVDPPRKGLDESFINASLKTKQRRIVYVSCNPKTLGRDLKHYVDAGYRVEKVQPVDMFPQTSHVESICALSLR